MVSRGGVGCHFSPSGSNAKNNNKSPMFIPILFHEVILNKCICHRFYFILCIQFSQLINTLYTSSEVALKSEVRAVDGSGSSRDQSTSPLDW